MINFSKLLKKSKTIEEKPKLSPEEIAFRRVQPWVKAKGDLTLRLDYEFLNPKSVVFDLGGYEGQWASDIFGKYGSKVFVFEPMLEYAKFIEKRFKHNQAIKVFRFGIGARNETIALSLDENASSAYKASSKKIDGRLCKASDFLKKENIKKIDLIKINIEGGEYDLLDHLIEADLIKDIRALQIQFHDFVPDAVKRVQAIRRQLKKTHVCTYSYPFVWENWELKKAA